MILSEKILSVIVIIAVILLFLGVGSGNILMGGIADLILILVVCALIWS